jgi:anti-anti-sigma regulatory factor
MPAPGPVLVALIGPRSERDTEAVSHLAEDLEGAIDNGATRLLVDLRETESLGTRGLNALLRARQRLLLRNGKIVVVLSRELSHRFDVLQLDRRFLFARDRLRAVQLLGLAAGPQPDTPVLHRTRAA